MKKFLFIAIASLALLSSCQRVPSVSSVKPEKIEDVPASGKTVEVIVSSDGEWTASTEEIKDVIIEPSSGSGVGVPVRITVPANTTDSTRSGKVTFYSVLGTSFQVVAISQKSPRVSVTLNDTTAVSALGGIVYVDVNSDGGWKTFADDGIAVNPSSYSRDTLVKVTVPVNSDDKRDVKVIFRSALNSSVADSVTIHQKSISFSVTPEETEVAASGGTVVFAVEADGGWKTFTEYGAVVNPSSGSGRNPEVKVTVPANTATQPRDIKISFQSTQNPSLSQTVIIHQKAPGISVEPIEGTVLAKGGDVTVNVISDGGFTVPAGDDFTVNCSDWKESGTKSVKITVKPNATGKQRDVKVTFCSKLESSISETVTIHQESISISVTPSANTVPASGGEVEFTVNADGAWKASTDTEGATVTPDSYSDLGERKVKVYVPANVTGLKRDVKVKFWLTQNPSICKTVTVSQVSITISVTPPDTTVSASGENFDVIVSSNGKWEAYVGKWKDSENQQISTLDQIRLSPVSGEGTKTVKVEVPANATGRDRYVEVEFRSTLNSSISQTVTIHQKPLSISVTEPTDSVPAAGETVGVTVTSDGDWTAYSLLNGGIPNPSSGSSGESVTITVPTNNTVSERDVKVRFYLTNHSTVSDTVTIHQKALEMSVTPQDATVSASKCTVDVNVTYDLGWRTDVKWYDSDGTTTISTTDKVTVSPPTGSGNTRVTIIVPENTSGKDRCIKVRFISSNTAVINKTVTIHQKASE